MGCISLTHPLCAQVRVWLQDGLPPDAFSIDNAIIVTHAQHWPLFIDPQAQASKWVRASEGRRGGLEVVRMSEAGRARRLESAVQFGQAVLLEGVAQDLDPALEPLLLKTTFKQVSCLRVWAPIGWMLQGC